MNLSHPSFLSWLTRRIAATALIVAVANLASKAEVAFDWNEAIAGFAASPANSLVPHLEARVFAMTHLAMDEAIVEAGRNTPAVGARRAAQRAAAASAARTILAELLPAGAARFDALAAAQLSALPDNADKTRAVKAGQVAAALVLSKRDHDGWVELTVLNPPDGPSPDRSSAAANALLGGAAPPTSPWLQAKPFILKAAGQFAAKPPYTLTHEGAVLIDFNLRNAKLFAAVDHSAAASSLERSWAGRPFATWNRIARSAAARAELDLVSEARLLAVLNLALADATLAVLHWRHELGTWRPASVDVWNSLDGTTPPMSTDELVNVDNGVKTEFARRDIQQRLLPPIQNFPAPVATLAGAAQAAIIGFFKDDRTPLALPEVDPALVITGVPPRVFANVSAAARECAFVASLDGRHSREACVSGYELGASIGSYVAKRAVARRN